MLIRNAMIYNSKDRVFFAGDILIHGGKIAAVGSVDIPSDLTCVIDAKGRRVIPGLIDVHTHGRSGCDFVNDNADLSKMAVAYAMRGITTVMPTIASAPLSRMAMAAEKINTFCPSDAEAELIGVHFEGRWLNTAKKGAHAPEMLASLDARELDTVTAWRKNDTPIHITSAFELDEDGSFAKKALSLGATLGLGHTCATYEQAKRTEELGVTAYTHLFNAMPPLHHRDGGAVCAALEGNCFAELICDGIHVSPEMIRLAYKNLGNTRLVLISDSMEATDMPDGSYNIAGNPASVKDGVALTDDGALAGSTLSLDTALKNLMSFTGASLEDTLPCATENPAREIGIFNTVGSIDVGKSANLLILSSDKDFIIDNIILRGNKIK